MKVEKMTKEDIKKFNNNLLEAAAKDVCFEEHTLNIKLRFKEIMDQNNTL